MKHTVSDEQIAAALRGGLSAARVGADLHVDRARVRRIRDALGIAPQGFSAQATDEQIAAALRSGLSVTRTAATLHADRARVRRIRDAHNFDRYTAPETTRTLEEKWASCTRPGEDGHLLWTGERNGKSGSPVMRHRDTGYSPAAVAFRQRTGRDPHGYVFAACGQRHCVAPDHVQDQDERAAARTALRGAPVPGTCRYGHAQAAHGRFEPDGTAYCARCSYLTKHPDLDDRPTLPKDLSEALNRNIEMLDQVHARWTGPRANGRPYLFFGGTRLTPAREVFRLHHGREPSGQVRPVCTVDECIAVFCLQDRTLRTAEARLYRAVFGRAAP
ncbi:hypothetical protein ABT127_34665 [Streptomyces sp. NPDC001904]|uniref:hypothetical protein n=1 Tax=Streptomyces sp. NPDC001904 TaxID=3154531 RepID=UPI00332B147A